MDECPCTGGHWALILWGGAEGGWAALGLVYLGHRKKIGIKWWKLIKKYGASAGILREVPPFSSQTFS